VETFAMASRQSDVQVSLDPEKKRVHISFPENISFHTGSAELKPGFAVYLSKLQPYITEFSRVQAVGHTDKRPVVGGRFKSNWELSSARAAAVIQKLIEKGIIQSHQAEVVGMADTSPLSLAETEAGYAMNRRVEIIIDPNYFERDAAENVAQGQTVSMDDVQIKK
jgi:chemotaxis protein MotB